MGNTCSDGNTASDSGGFFGKSSKPRQRNYNLHYDPVNIKNDPDIVSKDPYTWLNTTKNNFKFGQTQNVGFDPRKKAQTGLDLTNYPHGVYQAKRADGIDEPTAQIAKPGAMLLPSQLAQEHQKILGTYVAISDPATTKNKELGPFVYSSGNTYKGQYKLGQRSGIGIEVTPKGDIFEGQWINDMKFGKGRVILSNGDMYEGDWLNNNAQGNGVYVSNFKDEQKKTTYTGEVKNNKQNGKGKEVIHASKSCYTGEFVENTKHGQGEMIFPDQSRYVGEFANDKANGYGKFYYTDGRFYEGYYKENIKHGKGTYHTLDGVVYTGDFLNGVKHGQGIQTWLDGRKYEGAFVDGLEHGEGAERTKDNVMRKGIWENGNRIRYLN